MPNASTLVMNLIVSEIYFFLIAVKVLGTTFNFLNIAFFQLQIVIPAPHFIIMVAVILMQIKKKRHCLTV